MKTSSPFLPSFQQLPRSLPVFPLNSAVLLPRGFLSLNIFEPRYLNMLQDAMKADQLIGMIQPSDDSSSPELYKVGCVGRVTRYQETSDGRLEIELTGVCRFEVAEELDTVRAYRIIAPNWERFEKDFDQQSSIDPQAQLLFKATLKAYLAASNIELDLNSLEQIDFENLLSSLLGYLPLSAEDKQILLEADSTLTRVTAFTAMLKSSHKSSEIPH